MDLQAMFSDNQLAVLGCFVALGFCGGIAALSFHFGQAGVNTRSISRELPQRYPFPQAQKQSEKPAQQNRRAA